MARIVLTLEDGVEIVTELDSDVITVGRHPESIVVLPSTSVSSHHATIKRRGGVYFVQDLGTTTNLGSNFSINTSNPALLVPNSIAATFFRPFLWEVKSPVALFSAIESLLFLLFTLYFFFKKGVVKYFKLTFADPRMMMCFIFAIVFAIAVGASTSNFGALSRYKIPCMPFYFMGLLLVYKKAMLPYPKWFYKILKWI